MTVHDGHGVKKLPSDSRNRIDIHAMKKDDMDLAQTSKEEIEEV